MKKLKLLLLFPLIGFSWKFVSQNSSNHPIISNVNMKYRPEPKEAANSVLNIQAISETTLDGQSNASPEFTIIQ